jgi:hypothetical protein
VEKRMNPWKLATALLAVALIAETVVLFQSQAEPEPALAPPPLKVAAVQSEPVVAPVSSTERASAIPDGLSEEVAVLKEALEKKNLDIIDLRKRLGEKNEEVADAEERRPKRDGERGDGRGGDRSEFLQRLRERDPERYEEVNKAMNVLAERMTGNLGERFGFFEQLSTEQMSEDQLTNHEKLLEKMATVKELFGAMQTVEEPADLDAMRGQAFGTMRELSDLMEVERGVALKEMGTQLGYAEQEATDFAEYTAYILEMTSPRSFYQEFRNVMPGRGGGGGGPK